ncbi:4Fe-4S dicluster domain-containing protein [Pseudodesulfovibrio sp.]|uniref:4Fe-4S dicluster domain-containing protein n=1 Tax=unclassified Pseudodesulfovibrio TaxID=2661612 RepID=UPI003AFFD966
MAHKNKGKSTVTVYPDWCKGCGICVEFCPNKVFEISELGKATVVREQECIHCGFCELHCPDFAIVVRDKVQPAEKTGGQAPSKSGNKAEGA